MATFILQRLTGSNDFDQLGEILDLLVEILLIGFVVYLVIVK